MNVAKPWKLRIHVTPWSHLFGGLLNVYPYWPGLKCQRFQTVRHIWADRGDYLYLYFLSSYDSEEGEQRAVDQHPAPTVLSCLKGAVANFRRTSKKHDPKCTQNVNALHTLIFELLREIPRKEITFVEPWTFDFQMNFNKFDKTSCYGS